MHIHSGHRSPLTHRGRPSHAPALVPGLALVLGLSTLAAAAMPVRAQDEGAPTVSDRSARPAPADGIAAWNSHRALEILERAKSARAHAYADSSLTRFRARAQGHVYFLGDFRGEREVIRADQVALDILWQAPDRALQTIVGRRHEIRLPTNIHYHIDHLSLVLDNFGDRIRLGEGDEVWNALHPAAPSALEEYEYRLVDSLEVRIRDRRARVYELEIRPLRPETPGVVGSMFVDRESGAIARLRLTFTAASYRDPQLESIALDLRSALWDGRYWLPAEQSLEIRRSLSWLDFPLQSVIRTRLVVQDYDLDPDEAFAVGPGQRVATLPDHELDDFWLWESPLYGGPLEEHERSDAELNRALTEARTLVGTQALQGGERLQLFLPSTSDGIRLRRAEGVLVGGGGHYRIGDRTRTSFWGGYAAGSGEPELAVTVDRDLGGWKGRVELDARALRDAGGRPAASGVAQSLGLAFEGEDYTDPYFEDGLRASRGRRIGAARIEIGGSVRRQRSARLVVQRMIVGSRPLRPIRPIDEGELVALDTRVDVPLGRALGGGWTVRLRGEVGSGALGDFGFRRAVVALEGERRDLAADWGWSSELTLGVAGGELPAQRLFLLGGRGTLPGYGFRIWGGDAMVLWRAELSRGVAWPWVRARLSAAAGWVGVEDAGAEAAERFGVAETAGTRFSAGAGVGLFWDIVRVDLYRGLDAGTPGGPGDGGWALLVSLNPLLWDVL